MMKKRYAILYAMIVGMLLPAFGGFAFATDANPYYAGYQACNAKYKSEAGADNTEYANCIAKAKCEIDNPNDKAYCECVGNGGIKLNTNVPFIGRCINKNNTNGSGTTESTAFTDLVGGLSKIVVTAILVISFMFVIIGGVQWTAGNPKEGKAKIMKVAIGLAILGASGAILRLINPNFFK